VIDCFRRVAPPRGISARPAGTAWNTAFIGRSIWTRRRSRCRFADARARFRLFNEVVLRVIMLTLLAAYQGFGLLYLQHPLRNVDFVPLLTYSLPVTEDADIFDAWE